MIEETNKLNKDDNNTNHTGSTLLSICIAAYLFYAFFLLIECLDFSALLHSPEPGYHATYDMNNIIFYVIDLIICVTLGLMLMIINFAQDKRPYTVVIIVILITVLRACLIYYLYMFKEGSYQLAPFIYKKANEMSGFARMTILPLQVLAGVGCSWRWITIAKKQHIVR